ncbi:MAG: HAD family hydrolase [Bacteroidetes bacterium]|nr:MAG: HAD family hydrolase [Bacteroidota bacterium]
MKRIDTVVFDLGNVLIDWNPDYVYREIFPNEKERKWFYENICTSEWNEEQDAGRSLFEATELLVKKFPEQETNIRAYYGRWQDMLGGPIHGSVEILRHLKFKTDNNLYALTNWSHETFPVALEKYDFLHWFKGRVVSGEEKTRKPFPPIYETLVTRFQINPAAAVYVDDSLRNLEYPAKMGFHTIHFTSSGQFKSELEGLGVL